MIIILVEKPDYGCIDWFVDGCSSSLTIFDGSKNKFIKDQFPLVLAFDKEHGITDSQCVAPWREGCSYIPLNRQPI